MENVSKSVGGPLSATASAAANAKRHPTAKPRGTIGKRSTSPEVALLPGTPAGVAELKPCQTRPLPETAPNAWAFSAACRCDAMATMVQAAQAMRKVLQLVPANSHEPIAWFVRDLAKDACVDAEKLRLTIDLIETNIRIHRKRQAAAAVVCLLPRSQSSPASSADGVKDGAA